MRSTGAFGRAALTGITTLAVACSAELNEEKARLAAGKAQQAIRPLDAGAMDQEVDQATVRRVQEQLTALREYMGPTTGKLDPVTPNALESFQRTHGITPDGRFNEETLTALSADVHSSPRNP